MTTIMIIGNYDLGGTNKFCTHELQSDEETTLCGLKFSKLKGDWQFDEVSGEKAAIGCLRCVAIAKKRTQGTGR